MIINICAYSTFPVVDNMMQICKYNINTLRGNNLDYYNHYFFTFNDLFKYKHLNHIIDNLVSKNTF